MKKRDRIIHKMREINELPDYKEVATLFRYTGNKYMKNVMSDEDIMNAKSWSHFCDDNSFHQIFNKEFVQALADEIRKLDGYVPAMASCLII